MGRGAMFSGGQQQQQQQPFEDGISINQGYGENITMSVGGAPQAARPDMRGPQSVDLQNLLSGLKPRSAEQTPPPASTSLYPASAPGSDFGNDSLMSVTSLSDTNGVLPKRTHRRKQRSDRNIVSLDI